MTINLQKEIDENAQGNRNAGYKIKRKKVIEQKLDCKFIRTDTDKEIFDVLKYLATSNNPLINWLKNIDV